MAPLAARRPIAALERRYRTLAHRGSTVRCPCCGRGFDRFKEDWNRPGAICWWCGAQERHRALWIHLDEFSEVARREGLDVLHFAPEWVMEGRLRSLPGGRYTSADLVPGRGMVVADITALPFPDDAFDLIVVSHVMEHVEDDAAGYRELARVVRPGGEVLVMVPLDTARDATLEDPAVVTQQQRVAAYWQDDHVRLYAPDLADRMRAAGMRVEITRIAERVGPDRARLHGLLEQDWVFTGSVWP
jgi:SAM-dependent methyltransferase